MIRTTLYLIIILLVMDSSALAFRPPPTPREIDDLSRQIAGDPNNSRLYQYRGLDYAVLGEKEKAIADYRVAEKLTPVQHYLYWSYGWALFDLGDYPSAIIAWNYVLSLESVHHERDVGVNWSFSTLAVAYWAAGDREKAFAFFTKAAKENYDFRNRDDFVAFTDHWTQKEQTLALQLFDAWQKEVEKPGSHLW